MRTIINIRPVPEPVGRNKRSRPNRRANIMKLCSFLCLTALLSTNGWGADASSAAQSSLNIHVLTFNILNSNYGEKKMPWIPRRESVMQIISKHPYDFVGLQEESEQQLAEIMADAPALKPAGAKHNPRLDGTILYRDADWQELSFGIMPSVKVPALKKPKNPNTQIARFQHKATGQIGLIINGHIPWPAESEGRLLIFKSIRNYIENMNEPYDFVVFTGDLNSWESSPEFTEAKTIVPGGLESAWALARTDINHEERIKTMDRLLKIDKKALSAKEKAELSKLNKAKHIQIDYILVSPSLKVKSSGFNRDYHKGIKPSDHDALDAELIFSF